MFLLHKFVSFQCALGVTFYDILIVNIILYCLPNFSPKNQNVRSISIKYKFTTNEAFPSTHNQKKKKRYAQKKEEKIKTKSKQRNPYLTSSFPPQVPGRTVAGQDDAKLVESQQIICTVYLLVGSALVAMCFNLMQEETIENLKSFWRNLGCLRRQEVEDPDVELRDHIQGDGG